eukprot:16099_1
MGVLMLTLHLSFFSNLLFLSQSHVDLPSSCIGLDDGTYTMKLINDEHSPILSAQCSNEYMIINPSTDPNWSSYFTSWIKYHYGVAAPLRNDLVNWNEWFLPSALHTDNDFLISLDCASCDINSNVQKYGTDSSFYLSALAFGCFNPTRGWPSCDMEYDTYQCRLCHWNEERSQVIWTPRNFITTHEADSQGELTGICDFEIKASTDTVLQSYHECTTYIPTEYHNFKPSIGTDGRHCQCFKPQQTQTVSVTDMQYHQALNIKNTEQAQQPPERYTSTNHIVHLSQSDFEHGTLRIVHPGTYFITQDITFDFNAPDDASNVLSDDAWWPNIEDGDLYPGAGKSRDAFFLGFFAGITIETEDVILDLNGHVLKMSEKFYFSQPFFSIIELASQPFLPQEGPGFFGSDPVFASNVVIKNGILGLTSHHGVHGNYNRDITISNVVIRDFQTHGIQFNGYNNVILEDLDIGPSTSIAYLNGNYGQLRELLPTLRKLSRQHRTATIRFNDRDVDYTMSDLLNILEPLMRSAFDFAYHKATNNEIEVEALVHDLFINPSGLSYGAVTYGIFLNHPSAGIFGWHVNDAASTSARLHNIAIHDIHRQGEEVIGLAHRGRVYCNAFNGPLPLVQMLGGMDQLQLFADGLWGTGEGGIVAPYVGDIVTDIHFAMYEFGGDDFDNWPGIPYYGDRQELLSWAKGENKGYVSTDNDELIVYCNNDAMFHPSKGLLGIKVSVSDNVIFDGIRIHNLIDSTEFGHDVCGKMDLYHFSQQAPYQIGFSMNMVHGIAVDFSDVTLENDVMIDGIYSRTGLAFGISTWFDTQINHKSSMIDIANVFAGYDDEVNDHTLTYEDRPNKAPEACAIRIHSSDAYQVRNWFDLGSNQMDNIRIRCVYGDVGCHGNHDKIYTNLGNVQNEQMECREAPILYSNIKGTSFARFDTLSISYAVIGLILLVCLCCSNKKRL